MEDFAIKVENVSKEFKLPHEKNASIKSSFINVVGAKRGYELQKALDEVSFEIKKGEFFGIVGRNGSGKSTLLKLLAGIYTPTQGQVHVRGSLTPFIELGVGFNPELTGRENVYLNGALLGFSRKEMNSMYKQIVEFAELEKFMDQKLKNYSSGMQVRLAFSIAIQAKGDILILDEVLAVGDEAFQQKCISVFESYKAQKRTIVLVTHDMSMIKRFCSRAMLINEGSMIEIGDPQTIASIYNKLNNEVGDKNLRTGNKKGVISLKIKDDANRFNSSTELTVEMKWSKTHRPVKNIGIAIYKNSGEYIFGDNTFGQKNKLAGNEATYKVKLDIGPGRYHLIAGLFGEADHEVIAFEQNGPEFIVESVNHDKTEGLARLKSEWSYEKE